MCVLVMKNDRFSENENSVSVKCGKVIAMKSWNGKNVFYKTRLFAGIDKWE